MSNDTQKELLTYADLRLLLGYGRRTIQRLVKRGFPAPVELGSAAARFRRTDVMKWLENLPQRGTKAA
jgi:excisionase family DNA binding protein